MGDICQSLSEEGTNWNGLSEIFNNMEVVTFRHSYRSSDNIVEFNNRILKAILSEEEFNKYSPIPIADW
jgi:DNA helicase IV